MEIVNSMGILECTDKQEEELAIDYTKNIPIDIVVFFKIRDCWVLRKAL